jgi:hypothetical protein
MTALLSRKIQFAKVTNIPATVFMTADKQVELTRILHASFVKVNFQKIRDLESGLNV